MLVHVGDDRSVEVDLRLAIFLASVAGAVNAAGFRSMGYFSANMTGNVSSLSEHLALDQMRLVGWLAALVASFVCGAFASALLIEMGRRRRIRGIYAFSIVAEAVLIAVLALLEVGLPKPLAGPAMLVGLSFIMGLQNAATTCISNARVRTSHVSGIATDIGIELAVLLGGARDDDRRSVVRARFRLHVTTILAFLLGGVIGAILYGAIGAGLFLLVALLLMAIAIPEARRAYGPAPGA